MDKLVDWEGRVIVEATRKLMAQEKKNFMIAYGELPIEIAGYLSDIAKPHKIFYRNIPKEDLSKLKKDNSIDVWQYTDPEKAKKTPGIFFSMDMPYLTLDGMIAYANFEHDPEKKKIEQSLELTPKGDKIYIKAIIVSEIRGRSEGMALCKDDFSFEKNVSIAIRRAFNYMGYGRFPTHTSKYGEDSDIVEFRKFKIKAA